MAIDLRPFQFSNFARSTLAADLSADATTLTIQEDDVELFPTLDATYDEIFAIVLAAANGERTEIAYVTEVNGAVFTIERAKEDTTAVALDAGSVVVHTLTAGFPQQQLGAAAGAVVLTGAAVGSTQIDLSWTEALVGDGGSPVESYRIYRSVDSGTYTLLTTVLVANPRTYSDTTIALPSTYDYYVVAVSELGTEAAASNIVGVSGGTIVLAVDSGTTSGDTQKVMYSSDGINWTLATTPSLGSIGQGGGAYSPTLNLAIIAFQNGMWASDDSGQTWTDETPPSASITWSDVAWSPTLGLFLMVGHGTTNAAAWSEDGVNWTLHNMPNNCDWNTVIWDTDREIFICGGRAGSTPRSCYSITGKLMIAGGLNTATDQLAVSSTQAGGAPPGDFFPRYTSDPTSTWSVSSNNAGIGGISACAYSPENDIWVWGGVIKIASSPTADGACTTRYSDGSIRLKKIEWFSDLGLFIAGSNAPSSTGATYRIVTSPDGETWTERETPTKANNQSWERFFEASSVTVTGNPA